MKKFLNIFIILLIILNITACSKKDNGGGVIAKDEPVPVSPLPPVNEGPFGGPVANDEVINPASPYNPPYSAYDLNLLIEDAVVNNRNVVYLDRDVELFSNVLINYPITITSSALLGRPAKIYPKNGANLSNLITVNSDNVIFQNLMFEAKNGMIGVIETTSNGNGSPMYSNLTIDTCILYLRSNALLKLESNNLILKNSSIFGLSSIDLATGTLESLSIKPLVQIKGDSVSILGNNIIDVNNHYSTALLLKNGNGFLIKKNVIRSFSRYYLGTITGDQVSNVTLESNILHDANNSRVENLGYPDPAADGSIALAFQSSNIINDNGNKNNFAATHFIITDADIPAPNTPPNATSNIALTPGTNIPDFGSTQLFNYPATEDFHPVCALGTNPTLQTLFSPYLTVLNYNSGTNSLYYSGAIKPGCL